MIYLIILIPFLAIGIIIYIIVIKGNDISTLIKLKPKSGVITGKQLVENQRVAIYANATVLQAEGGMAGLYAGNAVISLTLQIMGSQPYIAHTRWLVSITGLHNLQEGQTVSVKVDRTNPKIIYPSASWATYIVPT